MLRLAANLPDAAIRRLPVLDGRFDGSLQDRPHDLWQVVPRLGVEVHGVEDGSPNIVLLLRIRGVADADGMRSLVAAQVVDGAFGQLALAADPIHDLQVLLSSGDIRDEVEKVVGFTSEAERG